ncbi:MAG: substrate-binding domain-containing protein [Pseudomonadota bacterium]
MALRLLSTLGLQGVIEPRLGELSTRLGTDVSAEFAPTQVMLARIADGARGDVAAITEAGIATLAEQGIVEGRRVNLARSSVGAAVRAGAPPPDLSTEASTVATLMAAPSIVYSKQGASGLFFAKLIERLGITDAINAKAIIIPQGFTGALVARGEAALAIQQMSELLAVPGLAAPVPLPDVLQEKLVFTAAGFVGGDAATLMDALVALCTPEVLASQGLTPA